MNCWHARLCDSQSRSWSTRPTLSHLSDISTETPARQYRTSRDDTPIWCDTMVRSALIRPDHIRWLIKSNRHKSPDLINSTPPLRPIVDRFYFCEDIVVLHPYLNKGGLGRHSGIVLSVVDFPICPASPNYEPSKRKLSIFSLYVTLLLCSHLYSPMT